MTKKTRAMLNAEATLRAASAFSRRLMLKRAAALGAVAAVGPFYARDALSSSGELNVMMWSDELPPDLLDGFTAATGIVVNHTPFGANEDLLNKITATKGRGFDLVGPTLDRAPQWQPLGLLQPFDMNRIDTKNILPSMLSASAGAWTWDGGQYHLPHCWGTEALAWRTDKWSSTYEELSLGDLWAEEMRGKVQGRPHSLMAGIGRYLDASGQVPSNRMLDAYKDEENMRRIWEEITKFAVEHKPWIKQFWNDADSQIAGFTQNDCVIGQTWDGPMNKLKDAGEPIAYMAPQEGAFAWLDGWSKPIGAENIDQIYEFLNYLYQAENNAVMANGSGYNPVAVGADQHLSASAKKNFAEAYPGDAVDKLWFWPPTEPWYAEARNEYVDKFVAA